MKSCLYAAALLSAFAFVSCNSTESSESKKTSATDSVAVVRQPEEPGDRGYIVAVGDIAPGFTLNVDDSTVFSLGEQRGKVVMLQFTASWCGICRKEMPHIESDIWKRFGSNPDFCLLGVDREETAEKVLKLKESTGITYPIAYDTEGAVFRLYAHSEAGITRNVLIDREGRIVMLTRKFEQDEFDALCSKIAEMLAE